MDTTLDGLLNRRITVEQPKTGYRIAIDTVFLAAAVPACAGETVLEFGCGVGGAMLCLAARVPEVVITGIEIQPELAELCKKNIERNGFTGKLTVHRADITVAPIDVLYDHVLINPPYHDKTAHDLSPDHIKRTATAEKSGDLALWLQKAAQVLNPSGTLTLIHRADRQQEITAELQKYFGTIDILALLPRQDAPPKRVILRARKSKGGIALRDFLILHQDNGGYSDAAEQVLRHATALNFDSHK